MSSDLFVGVLLNW